MESLVKMFFCVEVGIHKSYKKGRKICLVVLKKLQKTKEKKTIKDDLKTWNVKHKRMMRVKENKRVAASN